VTARAREEEDTVMEHETDDKIDRKTERSGEDVAQIRSAKRVLMVLEYVNQEGPTTVSAIARAVNLPRATAGRIVATLKSLGYLDEDAAALGVRPSRRVLNLAKGFETDLDRMARIRSSLSEVTRKLKWSLVFTRPSGTQVEIAATTDLESPLAIDRYHVGFRMPIHDTASGCAMLSASSSTVRDRVYGMLEQEQGPGRPASMTELQARIRRAETQGYAWHRRAGKREAVMAIPVGDGSNDAIGALGIRYIHSAMTAEDVARNLLPQVKEAALAVEQAWRL
jgi:IclR family mhp operon transcriptional activator